MYYYYLIHKEEIIRIENKERFIDAKDLRKIIKCDLLEAHTISLRLMDRRVFKAVLIIDEEGISRNRRINIAATKLWKNKGGWSDILGPAILCTVGRVEGGFDEDLCGFDEDVSKDILFNIQNKKGT